MIVPFSLLDFFKKLNYVIFQIDICIIYSSWYKS